jgi:hypothetical protein
MENDPQNPTPSADDVRELLTRLQGTSRERLLNALALYLAEEERRRDFLKKIQSI